MIKLTSTEQRVVDGLRAGEAVSLGASLPGPRATTRRVRGEVLRRLLLGAQPDAESPAASTPFVIDLEGAFIVGSLDLSDLRGPGGAVGPACRFRHCIFSEGLNLDDSHMGHFVLEGCRFNSLTAREAAFEGSFEILDCGSAEADNSRTGSRRPDDGPDGPSQGLCTVNLSGVVIEGSLRVCRTALCTLPCDPDFDDPVLGAPFALNVREAKITSSVVLQPQFAAVGGVSLSYAEVGGGVWLQGAYLSAEWSESALRLKDARITGGVALSALFRQNGAAFPFTAEGTVDLYATRIDGELYMEGARLRARPGHAALSGYMASISQLVRVSVATDSEGKASSIPFEAVGHVTFAHGSIGGFHAVGAAFDGRGGSALDLSACTVGGDLYISSGNGLEVDSARGGRKFVHRAILRGGIEVNGGKVAGSLVLQGVRVENRGGAGLSLYETEIGRSLTLTSYSGLNQLDPDAVESSVTLPTELADCQLNIEAATISGDLMVQSAKIGGGEAAIEARGVKIGDRAVLVGLKARGPLNFYSALVTHDLVIRDLDVSAARNQTAVLLNQARIGGNLLLGLDHTDRPVSLAGSRVEGDISVTGISRSTGTALDLDGARAAGGLQINFRSRGSVSMDYLEVSGASRIEGLVAASSGGATSLQWSARGAKLGGGLRLEKGALGVSARPAVSTVRRLRSRSLACYPGWRLVEVLSADRDEAGVSGYLWDGEKACVTLAGSTSSIHELNRRPDTPLRLTARSVPDYLTLFCGHFWTDGGAFSVIRDPATLTAHGLDPAELADHLDLTPEETEGGWLVKAILDYEGRLTASVMKVEHDGSVTMVDTRDLTQPRPRDVIYAAPLRLKRNVETALALELLRRLQPDRPWPVTVSPRERWTDLGDDPESTVRAIATLGHVRFNGEPLPLALPIRRVRTREISCYAGWRLVEGLADSPAGQSVFRWLWDGEDRGVPLTGNAADIHGFNLTNPPDLQSDEQALDYVRFFCANVWGAFTEPQEWGAEGPFTVIDDGEELPFIQKDRDDSAGAVRPARVLRRGVFIDLEATICFGGQLFHSDMRVHPSGLVEMTGDSQIDLPPLTSIVSYVKPLILSHPRLPVIERPEEAEPWPLEPAMAGGWTDLDQASAHRFLVALAAHQDKERLIVRLTAAHADFVDDDFGRSWGNQVLLKLSGFSYDQIDRVEDARRTATLGQAQAEERIDAAVERRRWLHRQFEADLPANSSDFDSQPHTQLANVYRQAGRTDDAREIVRDKLSIEGRLGAREFRRLVTGHRLFAPALALGIAFTIAGLMWPPYLLIGLILAGGAAAGSIGPRLTDFGFNHGFGYGLYSRNALITFLAFLVIGWIGVAAANRQQIGPRELVDFAKLPQVMMVDVTTVHDAVVVTGEPDRPIVAGARTYAAGEVAISKIPCGEDIDPFLYATDVFVPLIDLRQETKCSPEGSAYSGYWKWAKAIYAFLGWIITSLMILTVSGVLRSRAEH